MKLWTHTTLAAGAVLLAGATLGAQAIINGAGATFPNPIYQKWFAEYNKLHSDVRINYQPLAPVPASSRSASGPCSSAPPTAR